MKKTIFYLCLGISVSFFSQVPTNGLVGSWVFNGNANDASGSNNHGTVNGATFTTDRCGNPNNAYHFNGSNSSILMSLAGPTGTVSRSLSYWIRTKNQMLSPTAIFDYGHPTGNGDSFQMLYNYNCIGIGIDVSNQALLRGGNCLSDSAWHHVVAVYDASVSTQISSVVFYIDGLMQPNVHCFVTGTTAVINTANLYPITIGKACNLPTRYFNGDIDDIYLYNRPLSPQEVQQLYTPCGGITLSGPTSVCASVPVIYTVTPVPGSNFTWSLPPGWTGSSTASTILVTPGNSPGNVGIIYTPAASSCNSNTTTLSLAVAINSVSAAPNASVICRGTGATLTASGGGGYSWQPGGATTPTLVVTPTVNSTYTLIGTPSNCPNTFTTTVSVGVSPCLGIEDEKDDVFFSMYPNPTDGRCLIKLLQAARVKIINSLGKIVAEDLIKQGSQQIDLSGEASGIYFIQVRQDNYLKTFKLIKE